MTAPPSPTRLVLPSSSLWTATAIPEPPCPPLAGERSADVCVVGGGYTGLSAALHLAEAGATVVLLEAAVPGYGASGRNGGQVIPGLKLDPDAMETWLGPDRGARLVELVGGAADLVFALVRRHGIACDARQDGWIKATHTEAARREAARTARDWSRRGAPVEELDRRRIAELTGTEAYLGGFVDHRGGVVQPLSYARGLAAAALKAGARIHTGALVTGVRRDGTHWVVTARGGTVRAPQVLLGTNGYTDLAGGSAPWPRLAETVIPVYSYIAATKPLSEDLRRTILPKGHAVSDSWRLLRYFRLDGAGRLVMGGRGKYRDSSDPADYRPIMASARAVYPEFGRPDWEFVWGGRVALTLDHLPHLHELAPGVHAALGYNGRGAAMATLLGKCLAERAQGTGDAVFPATPLRPVPYHRWRRVGIGIAVAWKRTLDRLDDARAGRGRSGWAARRRD